MFDYGHSHKELNVDVLWKSLTHRECIQNTNALPKTGRPKDLKTLCLQLLSQRWEALKANGFLSNFKDNFLKMQKYLNNYMKAIIQKSLTNRHTSV